MTKKNQKPSDNTGDKKARKKADDDLSKTHKGDNVEGSLKALGRLLRGGK